MNGEEQKLLSQLLLINQEENSNQGRTPNDTQFGEEDLKEVKNLERILKKIGEGLENISDNEIEERINLNVYSHKNQNENIQVKTQENEVTETKEESKLISELFSKANSLFPEEEPRRESDEFVLELAKKKMFIQKWFENFHQTNFSENDETDDYDFVESLRDGILLCNTVNKKFEQSISSYDENTMKKSSFRSYFAFSNINNFLLFCKQTLALSEDNDQLILPDEILHDPLNIVKFVNSLLLFIRVFSEKCNIEGVKDTLETTTNLQKHIYKTKKQIENFQSFSNKFYEYNKIQPLDSDQQTREALIKEIEKESNSLKELETQFSKMVFELSSIETEHRAFQEKFERTSVQDRSQSKLLEGITQLVQEIHRVKSMSSAANEMATEFDNLEAHLLSLTNEMKEKQRKMKTLLQILDERAKDFSQLASETESLRLDLVECLVKTWKRTIIDLMDVDEVDNETQVVIDDLVKRHGEEWNKYLQTVNGYSENINEEIQKRIPPHLDLFD